MTLTLLTARPDLVATAAVHEPPLWGLLEGTHDPAVVNELSAADTELAVVQHLIRSGDHRDAAQHFIEHVALGPGTWDQLPEPFRAVLEANAPTFLDEMADQTALSIDNAALATTAVPLLLTQGTDSPALFRAVTAELQKRPRRRMWKSSTEPATSPTPPTPRSGSLASWSSTSSIAAARTRRVHDRHARDA